jgi:dihydroflavonol-4-reductase
MGRFLVLGATGFLGQNLVSELLRAGHAVVAASRNPDVLLQPGSSLLSPEFRSRVETRRADVLDAESVERAAQGVDGAFVTSGLVTRGQDAAAELHQLHVVGTRVTFGALAKAGVRRVVLASTSGTVAVGSDPERIHTEGDQPPLELIARWPYYRTKYYGEKEALSFAGELEVVIANPSLLLGPGDFRESSTADIRRFLERSIPALPRGGVAFVDVRDAALGMRLCFEKGRAGERYLFNAQNITVAGLFQRLERLTGVKAPLLMLPRSPALAVGLNDVFSRAVRAIGGEPPVDSASVELGQYFWYANSAKAERELGWTPRDPAETLRATVDDLVSRQVVSLQQWPARAVEIH